MALVQVTTLAIAQLRTLILAQAIVLHRTLTNLLAPIRTLIAQVLALVIVPIPNRSLSNLLIAQRLITDTPTANTSNFIK